MRPAQWPKSPPRTDCRGRPRTAFVEHADTLMTDPEPVRVLGIDETRRGKPRWAYRDEVRRWVRMDPWDTGFVDLDGDQGLLGQRTGRTGAAVIGWLQARSPEFREAVEFVAIDPAAVYASAMRTPGLLPNATIVVDHFHLVKPANEALSNGRRRVTWDLRQRRGRKVHPEWANRRRLLTARERLSGKSFATMWNRIHDEDPSAQILSAWIAKEELRTLLASVRVAGDAHRTRHRLHRFLSWCGKSQIPELLALARTIDAARDRGVPAHRHHQCPHRGLQPAGQTSQACRVRVPQHRQLDAPDPVPLHPPRSSRGADLMLTADTADSMAVELLIAVNPDQNSRLPYLLQIPLTGGDLVFCTSGTWPRTKALYRYPAAAREKLKSRKSPRQRISARRGHHRQRQAG
jgi:hypothetical protein